MRRLIVNADDFGWSEEVTRGILQAHQTGILTSTTVMMNLPGAAGAIDLARREAPRLGVGIHLNLTEGEPVAPRDKVTDILDKEGRFHRSPMDLFRLVKEFTGALAAAEAELEAQIVRAKDCGLVATHLDSHKHVHMYPYLTSAVFRLAKKHGVRAVRTTPEFKPAGLARLLPAEWGMKDRVRQWINAVTLRRWGRSAQAGARKAGLATTDWFFGVRVTGGVSAEVIELMLRTAPEGTGELMTHPGMAEPSPARLTRLGTSRPRELAALCDERVRRAVADRGWTLATYRDLSS
jgi:chitin disaccharide deacetylase